jgi:dTDP-4-amino-4,6-dideoxygalactose transaminase
MKPPLSSTISERLTIPFSPPFIDDDVRKEVSEALDSGWITTGPKVLALEKGVAAFSGIPHVVCCNSATSSLILTLHWFGVGPEDEVIIPAYTYAATALAVMHLGATPVMVDCSQDFNIDVRQIGDKITSKTKAIIPVDIGGWPCDYKEISELVNRQETRERFNATTEVQRRLGRILVLADSAHSLGAIYHGKPAAQAADITVFSFHAVKNVTTAEGGAICLNLPGSFDNRSVRDTLKLWSLNGQTKDAFTKTQAGGWKYDIVYPGFKMNMPDICAAIGIAQLRKYTSRLLPERKRVEEAYRAALSRFLWAELPFGDTEVKKSSCHLFALRIRGISEEKRDAMIEHISSRGISVNVHFQRTGF